MGFLVVLESTPPVTNLDEVSVTYTLHPMPYTLSSRVLDDHALDNVGDVLAAVDGGFEFLVNVLPLEHFQWIAALVEQGRDRAVINIITFIFETVQFHQPLGDALRFGQ